MQLPASPLGRKVAYPTAIDPTVLFAVPRAQARDAIGLRGDALPFTGVDAWNAWEFSWLDARGLPRVAVLRLSVPCKSPNLVESKSLKLYLGGYALTRLPGTDVIRARVERDVTACVGAQVAASLVDPVTAEREGVPPLAGETLDDQRLDVDAYDGPHPEFLCADAGGAEVEETLSTRLFRAVCPITAQPDWGSFVIHYRGPRIDRGGLLRYLVSYRAHPGFHEACAERIFRDVAARCAPTGLSVQGRFLRRGGIDINPWRATPRFAAVPGHSREARQ